MIPTIQGRCRATALDAKGLGDAPFLRAASQGRLREFLNSLPVAERSAKVENLVLDNYAGQMFFQIWRDYGCPTPESNWHEGETTMGLFAIVNLSNDSTEPSYQEFSGTIYAGMHAVSNSVDATYGSKRFVEDDVDAFDLAVHTDGREAIVHTARFLWLPSQGTLSDIRSVACWWGHDADNVGTNRRIQMTRVRLKDSGGNPITMGKTANQALLVEYEHEFVSN